MDIKDIKEKTITGSKWSVIEKFSLQIIQFIVGIVLARLLGPKAFGLIALTSIFITISGAIMDGGFEKALIQNPQLTSLQVNTAFYINTFLGIVMAAVVFFTSPAIARFFDAPELIGILRVLAIGLPVDAFGQTQRMLLIKELNFKKISIAQVCSAMVSAVVGIMMAYNGFGVWSLVYSSLAGTVTIVFIFWYKSPWYPKLLFSYSSISKMIPFGLNVLASSILFFFTQQFNNVTVGKYFSKEGLGLFNRGMKFPELISGTIQGVILKMSFPLFSKLQSDEMQLKNVLGKSTRMIAFLTFPLLAYLFIDAKEVVLFLLTDKWLGAVLYLRIFCLINLLSPFISLHRELLLAKGRAKLLFWLLVLTSVVEIVLILLVVKSGIEYVAYVALASKIIQFIIYQMALKRNMNIPYIQTCKWIIPFFLTTIFIVGGIILVNKIMPDFVSTNLFIKLAIDFLLGATFYFLIAIRYKFEELLTLKLIASSLFKFNKS